MVLFSNRFVSIFLAVLIWEIFLTHSHAGPLPSSLDNLSAPDRSALAQAETDRNTGILVTDDQGQVLFSRNADTARVPASILKVLTSLAALEHLGAEYRFLTRAAYDPGTRTLSVQGLGDPLFVSEVIRDFCGQMANAFDLQQVDNIVIDQSYFATDIIIPGTGRSLNPYDATTGALCANFNTLHFAWDAATTAFVSAEPQTPLLARFKQTIEATGLKQGRMEESRFNTGRPVRFFPPFSSAAARTWVKDTG